MLFRRVIPTLGAALWLLSATAAAQPAGVVPPKLLEHAEAPYPPSKLTEHVEADVGLIVTVNQDGSVSDPQVAESGGEAFDQAALETVRAWRFSPATQDGKPIRARIRVRFHFAPPHEEPAQPPPPAPAPSPQPAKPQTPPPSPPPSKAPPEKGHAEKGHAEHAEPIVVNVVGRSTPPSRGASDFVIQLGELAKVPRRNASEMLTLAPGILLTNEGGEGHAEQVFLRGFDAREGQDLEFTVNGVPINESGNLHGNGYADTHFIIPELVSTLRVVEGPFDPRQGNYAVAGSAEYELGLAQRGLTAKYTVGSWNSHRLLLLWGPRDESNHTFGGVELYRSDGFGQNRDSKRASAMGQYEGRLGTNGTFRILGTAYLSSYHSAGVIRQDDFQRGKIGFYDTYDPAQGGDASRYTIAADIETKSGETIFKQQVFVTQRGFRLRENFTGFLLDVQEPLQSPHGQRGDLLDLDQSAQTIGARGSARLRGEFFGQRQELELGYFARGDHVDATQMRVEAATGHPYHTDTSLDSRIGDIGLYADANLRPLSWITLRGGLRGDLFAYDVLDRCAVQDVAHPSKTNPPGDASCLSQQDFGNYREPVQRSSTASIALLPRASLLLGPFKGFTFNVSVGRGVRSIDPQYITQDVNTPFASIVGYEGGVAYAQGFGWGSLVARSVVFQTRVDRDLIFSETAGRNVLGGGTTRTGWVGTVRATGEHFDVNVNATLVKSTFDDTGLLVPYVPDAVVRADAVAFGALPLKIREEAFRGSIGAGFTFVGHRPLPYGQRSDLDRHARRVGHAGLVALRDRVHRSEPRRPAIPARRVQLRVGLPHRRRPDARPRSAFHGGRAARVVRDLRRQLRRFVMSSVVRSLILAALAAPLSACVGTTGSDLVTFDAAAAGPADAVAGQPYAFTSGRGYDVMLTRAKLHVGAVYLNRSRPVSGAQATNCILPGTYVAEVTDGLDVDVLSPEPQKFPVKGEATETRAIVAEVWLAHGDVNADEDGDAILDVAGTASRNGVTIPFEGLLTIGSNRKPLITDPSIPSAHPICKERIVSPIDVDITPQNGGSLLLRIDPRGWFTNVDFEKLAPPSDGSSTYAFADETVPGPDASLYHGIQARLGVYQFSWVEGTSP
ncbi:MAG: TonB family protein [Minicystis sp.]